MDKHGISSRCFLLSQRVENRSVGERLVRATLPMLSIPSFKPFSITSEVKLWLYLTSPSCVPNFANLPRLI
jgi:hypothetical protein